MAALSLSRLRRVLNVKPTLLLYKETLSWQAPQDIQIRAKIHLLRQNGDYKGDWGKGPKWLTTCRPESGVGQGR